MDKYYELNSFELAEYVGNCWGGNSDEFIKCFSENALIDHPFFSEPVSPKIAMEVIVNVLNVVVQKEMKGVESSKLMI